MLVFSSIFSTNSILCKFGSTLGLSLISVAKKYIYSAVALIMPSPILFAYDESPSGGK